MIFEVKNMEKAAALFGNWQETLIWSCLQQVMGKLYGDSEEEPASVMALLGDFCYFAGEPNRELTLYKPKWCRQDFVIMVPQNERWAEMIESCYPEKAKKVIRYAIKKEPGIFDREKLQKAVDGLPAGYSLKMVDEELFYRCKENKWCRDWTAQYENYELYQKHGLGAVILKEGEPVSGACSYTGYREGIEVEVDTKEEYRRQGLAYICAAKLILECLDRGWYASWDAQNKWSVGLAQKLGYHFDREYTAYEIWGY